MKLPPFALLAFAAAGLTRPAHAAPAVGQPAPVFQGVDSNGQRHALSDYRGKTVVLEWTNPGCPFVQAHYGAGNMQRLQAAAAKDGVVWLTVNSGAPGKQGHLTGPQANAQMAKDGATPAAYLLDPAGEIGRTYAAKTTPHMFVIDPSGTLAYAGGIDDKPTGDAKDIPAAKNHVLAALGDVKAGRAVATPTARAYGCSVKY